MNNISFIHYEIKEFACTATKVFAEFFETFPISFENHHAALDWLIDHTGSNENEINSLNAAMHGEGFAIGKRSFQIVGECVSEDEIIH